MAIKKPNLKANYTKIPNELIVSDISANAFRILIYLLSKPNNWEVNQNKIAKDLKINISTVKKSIIQLKEIGCLEIDKTSTGKGFVYTYSISDDTTIPTVEKTDGRKNRQLKKPTVEKSTLLNKTNLNKTNINKTNINNKNIKKGNIDESIEVIENHFTNQEVNVMFNEFLENRKVISGNKKINTELSIKRLVNELNKHDDETKKQMLNTSIANGYKGVFPPKKKNNKDKINEDYLKDLLDE